MHFAKSVVVAFDVFCFCDDYKCDIVFFLDGSGEGPAVISDAIVTLKGHKSRITDMCWSPHLPPAKLLTVSYDGMAIVSLYC